MPQWHLSRAPIFDARLQPFADYLDTVRGDRTETIYRTLRMLTAFERHRQRHRRAGRHIQLSEIDDYITSCRRRFSKHTILAICSAIRAYLRFLHVTGEIDTDLAASVIAPTIRRPDRPYPVLPWTDVQRILRAIDRRQPQGRRDYALLLMMSVYGLGAGEVIRLRLDDVDWRASTIRVVRPKTGVEFLLPLLPAVGHALADYLSHGRPAHALGRELFVTTRTPFSRFSASSAVRRILHKAARRAGVSAPFLGTHVLRHTYASRQLGLGTPIKVIGDVLGHQDPKSTSVYTRVSSDALRELSLPVPT